MAERLGTMKKSTRTEFTAAETEFSYPPSATDMLRRPSMRSHGHATTCTDPSSSVPSSTMVSSMYSSEYTHPRPGDEIVVIPPSPMSPYHASSYYPSEADLFVDDEEHKDKKKKKKKRHESKRSASACDRQSSRRTMDSSGREKKSSSERLPSARSSEGRERHGERKERRHESRGEDDPMLDAEYRRLRRERRREEEMENPELRRERRERRERRKERAEDGSSPREGRRERRHSRTGSSSHQHHHSSVSSHRHSGSHLSRSTKHRNDIHTAEGFPIPLEHVEEVPVAYVEEPHARQHGETQEPWAPHKRRPAMDVPRTIEVVMPSTDSLDTEPDRHTKKKKSRPPMSDYDRLMKLLQEQNDKGAGTDDPAVASSKEQLPSPLHPLIAASDDEFQEAFDALARDSVFDDNFEKAFNEFSEHYLALSPWGEDDSQKDKNEKGGDAKHNAACGEADFIQIPLTPVSRRGLTSYIAKSPNGAKKVHYQEGAFDEIPRTPTVNRGVLDANAMEKKESDKNEAHGGEEFTEVSRTPFYRRGVSSDAESIGKSNGHASLPARLPDSKPNDDSDEVNKADEHRQKKWGILRGRRGASKATI